MKYLIAIISLFGFLSCQDKPLKETLDVKKVAKEYIDTIPLFDNLMIDYSQDGLILPEGFSYKVLFSEFDSVMREDGLKFPAKGNHDLSIFIPDEESPNTKGWLYISHETKYKSDGLGDGGGATMFQIALEDNGWQVVGEFNHVDFSPVGYTNRNCGGSLTPNGTIFTCEESWSHNTAYLYMDGNGLRDTSWVNGRPAWQNMGYIVEVDPKTRKVLKKHYQMGKFVHEDVLCSKDGKAVYLTDDMNPAVFFKFEPSIPFEYETGKLYAFQQNNESGTWLELPNDTSAWINIRNEALKMGATMFIRHEWIEEINGELYISETGQDHYNLTQSNEKGGQFSNYAINNLLEDSLNQDFDDPYGRILKFNPELKTMMPFLEGGIMDDGGCFSSPDCNTSVKINGRTYLVISEDIVGMDRSRAGEMANEYYNELYFLDMSIENPDLNDLKRFAIAPKGSETTGVIFTPDGKHMILNIQHPKTTNPAPFNKSCTIIISGFNVRG